MKIYLNWTTNSGTETVDEFEIKKDQKVSEFKKYVDDMVKEYHLAGMDVYKSSRSTKEWKK